MRTAPKLGILVGALVVTGVAVVARRSAPLPEAAQAHVAAAPKKPEAPVSAPEPKSPRPPVVDASVPPPPHPAPKTAAAAKPKLLGESELMERLRKAQDTDDYLLSYDLAREGLRRFPDSPDAPEMAAMVVKSIARQGKISEARAEAEEMVNKYPGTTWAREVERHTGAHPHVNQSPPK
jgi:hypothetical protein